ncbi:hypothetical protein ACO0QE_000055 [Hanseniaspora vineae]
MVAGMLPLTKTLELQHLKENKEVSVTQGTYDKFVYFSKMCALATCITNYKLKVGETLYNGGCPSDLKFCSDVSANPALKDTVIEVLLKLEEYQLGTGFLAVDHYHKILILVFRGSSTSWDWFHNFLLMPSAYDPYSKEHYEKQVGEGKVSPCDNCKLHYGFSNFWKTLHPEFVNRLESFASKYTDYKLIIAGHSLGGVLATMAGVEFKLRGFEPQVVTFAQPKLFNKEMAHWVNQLFGVYKMNEQIEDTREVEMFCESGAGLYRVVHKNDRLVDIPFFFHHAGLQIDIDKYETPHEIKDLKYVGISEDVGEARINSSADIPEDQKVTAEMELYQEDWLHMYEHRNYFIRINECGYI